MKIHAMLSDALLYPFRKSNGVMLFLGTITMLILNVASAAPLIGFVVAIGAAGYFCAFYFSIIASSLAGDEACPDWPSVANFWDDLLIPQLRFLWCIFISALPLLAFFFIADEGPLFPDEGIAWASWGILASIPLGLLYYPMAVLGLMQYGNIVGTLPHIVLPAIVRSLPGYLLPVAAFVFLVGINLACEEWATGFPWWIGAVISAFASLYFLMAQARLIARVYIKYEERIGWFA